MGGIEQRRLSSPFAQTDNALAEEDLRSMLARFCDARLMLELDGRYLSLAVPVLSRTVDEAASSEAFALAF
ncbi:hypothetical protein [Hamadaea tsunoensis]|uniref:hypothetical protein n=1 Tax=Hamadaea tsunoensis TaxID=53368 RepID=UPI0004236D5B|nr:hypothetical protein [Hamadaea tsunoensis]